jgi:hypothetical protein
MAIFVWRDLIFGRRRKPPRDVEGSTGVYLSALGLFMIAILCGLAALIGVMDTALGFYKLNIGETESFNWGKWLLFDEVLLFAMGIFIIVLTRIEDVWKYIKSPPK